jgi:hypothetical protein
VRNVFKYSSEYTPGAVPELIEGDVFKMLIPLLPSKLVSVESFADWPEVRNKFGINSEKTLELIFQNGFLSAIDIAVKINISLRAVQNN